MDLAFVDAITIASLLDYYISILSYFKFVLLQGPDDFIADSLHWSSLCSGPSRHSHSFRNWIGQMGGQDADGDGGSQFRAFR